MIPNADHLATRDGHTPGCGVGVDLPSTTGAVRVAGTRSCGRIIIGTEEAGRGTMTEMLTSPPGPNGGTVAFESVAFDLRWNAYVAPINGRMLSFDDAEAFGWDGTLRDIPPTPAYVVRLCQPDVPPELGREAVRLAFMASYCYDTEVIDDDELRRVNDLAESVIGCWRLERLASICTGEHWSSEDMARCALNDDDLLQVFLRLDLDEDGE